jgi:hypothetical protein
VAERVVDDLEAVEVDVEHRGREVVPARASQRGGQVRLELGAVREAGQCVVMRHDRELRRAAVAAVRLPHAHDGAEAEREQQECSVGGGVSAQHARDRGGEQHHRAGDDRFTHRIGDRGEDHRQDEPGRERGPGAPLEHDPDRERGDHEAASR